MILALALVAYVVAPFAIIAAALAYYARDERARDRAHQAFMRSLTGEEHSYHSLYGRYAPPQIDRPSRARRHA